MSTHAEPRSAQFSLQTQRKGNCFSRALRCVRADGKPTKVPNRNGPTPASFDSELTPHFIPFDQDSSPLSAWSLSECSSRPCRAARIESMSRKPANDGPHMGCGQRARNLFKLHGLVSVANRTGIDKISFREYASIHRCASRCGHSTAKARSSVPGALVNQGVELRL